MKEKITKKLEELKYYVGILESYKDKSEEEISDDVTLRGAIERYLQVAIECALDIGEMVISSEGLRKADTYKDVILRLGEAGVLEKDFAERFSPAAGFRNILVHHYAEINVKDMYLFLQGNIDDFSEFALAIGKYLKRK